MYSITNTEGIILKSIDQGESDVLVSILTKDLGHIYAKASGVRDTKSKNRYALQEHSLSHFSLIQGKNGWRITNTSHLKSLYFEPLEEIQRETILKIMAIVKRLYIGEDGNPKIFNDLVCSFDKICSLERKIDIEKTALMTLFDFLNDLGYIEDSENFDFENTTKFKEIISKGIRESGL